MGTYGAQHQSPVQAGNMGFVGDPVEREVGDITQHDSKGRPHLPHHNQASTDGRRSTFGGVDWDGSGLRTDSKSKEEACDEEVFP